MWVSVCVYVLIIAINSGSKIGAHCAVPGPWKAIGLCTSTFVFISIIRFLFVSCTYIVQRRYWSYGLCFVARCYFIITNRKQSNSIIIKINKENLSAFCLFHCTPPHLWNNLTCDSVDWEIQTRKKNGIIQKRETYKFPRALHIGVFRLHREMCDQLNIYIYAYGSLYNHHYDQK